MTIFSLRKTRRPSTTELAAQRVAGLAATAVEVPRRHQVRRAGTGILMLTLLAALATGLYMWWQRRCEDEEYARLMSTTVCPDVNPAAPQTPPPAPGPIEATAPTLVGAPVTVEAAFSAPTAPAPVAEVAPAPAMLAALSAPVVAEPVAAVVDSVVEAVSTSDPAVEAGERTTEVVTPAALVAAPVAETPVVPLAPARAIKAAPAFTQIENAPRPYLNAHIKERTVLVRAPRPSVPFRAVSAPRAMRAPLPGTNRALF